MKTTLRCLFRLISLTALCAAMLVSRPAHANNTGDYIHNAPGRIRIGYVHNGETHLVIDMGSELKRKLDSDWRQVQERVGEQIVDDIRLRVGMDAEVSAIIAGPENSELRVLRSSEKLWVKYILHENKVLVSAETPAMDVLSALALLPLPDVTMVASFDTEFLLMLDVSGSGLIRVTDIKAYVRNIKVDSGGLGGDIVQPLVNMFGPELGDFEAKLPSQANSFKEELNAWSASLVEKLGQIPEMLPNLVVEVSPVGGTISLCFTADPSIRCAFPALAEGDAVRPVMDSSIDRCSRPVVWLWDVEKARYIGIRKGDQNVEVEVNWEFPWYCGWEDNYGDEERAAGPKEMNAVRVSREPDGRRIDWQFLYWKADRPPSVDMIVDEHVLSLEPAPSSELPFGSWRNSCNVETAYFDDAGYLRAYCYQPDGIGRETFMFQPQRCLSEPSNYEGHLFCLHSGFPSGSGSYQESCAELWSGTDSSGRTVLTAQCRRMDGSWTMSVLESPELCASTIANLDGRLTCDYQSRPIESSPQVPVTEQTVEPHVDNASGAEQGGALFVIKQPGEHACLTQIATFEWTDVVGLPEGHAYEIVVFRDGEDPMTNGLGVTQPDTRMSRQVDLAYLDSVHDWFSPGEYYWGVLDVSESPYVRHGTLGVGNVFQYAGESDCVQ